MTIEFTKLKDIYKDLPLPFRYGSNITAAWISTDKSLLIVVRHSTAKWVNAPRDMNYEKYDTVTVYLLEKDGSTTWHKAIQCVPDGSSAFVIDELIRRLSSSTRQDSFMKFSTCVMPMMDGLQPNFTPVTLELLHAYRVRRDKES